MTSRILRTGSDVDSFCALLRHMKTPLTVSWSRGADRSKEQNALSWVWAAQAADQLQDRDAADVRAEWKLTIGVPILRAENETFRDAYDKTVRDLSYEDKIVVMRDLDFPVTRLMNLSQMSRFMDAVQRRAIEQGVELR